MNKLFKLYTNIMLGIVCLPVYKISSKNTISKVARIAFAIHFPWIGRGSLAV